MIEPSTPPPNPPPSVRRISRADLIRRLYRLLERQIAHMETQMTDPGDKEVAVLGNLTRNLEKLIELDQKEKGRRGTRKGRADIDALRQKLSRRIAELKNS